MLLQRRASSLMDNDNEEEDADHETGLEMNDTWMMDDIEEEEQVGLMMHHGKDMELSARPQRRRRRRRRNPFHRFSLDDDDDDEDPPTSCLGDFGRLGASLLLAVGVLGWLFWRTEPPSYSSNDHHRYEPWPADGLSCAASLHISYAETFERLQNASDFCGPLIGLERSDPNNNHCNCHHSPLMPNRYKHDSKSYRHKWDGTFDRNQELARNAAQGQNIDLVLLGDSITEHFVGTDLGNAENGKWEAVQAVFQQVFSAKNDKSNGGSSIRGLALGIGGDTTAQLHYRILNGEVPDGLQPKVWWIEIGTNDLGDSCSAESALMGVIRAVQALQSKRPEDTIVVNSILPRGREDETHLRDTIAWINERLQCFAQSMDLVQFFDATDLFLMAGQPEKVDVSLLGDRLHPTAKGARVWLEAIRKYTVQLLQNMNHRAPSDGAEVTSKIDSSEITTVTEPVEKSVGDSTTSTKTTKNTAEPISPTTDPYASWPSDQVPCAGPTGLNISFSAIYSSIQAGEGLCRAEVAAAKCQCGSPLQAVSHPWKEDHPLTSMWDASFQRNKELALNASSTDLDVVILGDSITEQFVGTNLGRPLPKLKGIKDAFQELFSKDHGGEIQGLALGISGDICQQLFFRIANGEIPDTLHPKMWWIEIGTNNIPKNCSVESILMGILVIAQVLQRKRPNVPVVINSIFPRGNGVQVSDLIVKINDRLKCYAEGVENLEFFDATDLFLLTEDRTRIDAKLLPDFLHPSAEGARVWGREIVKKVKTLISE